MNALDSTISSGSKTASALIRTGKGIFSGIIISTDGTNAVTLDIYDNTSAAGTKLVPTLTITSSAVDRVQSIKPPGAPVSFETGLYVNVSVAGGGSCSYVAYSR